jgi:pimeloyl-ACP methyl ester carboxylesterase
MRCTVTLVLCLGFMVLPCDARADQLDQQISQVSGFVSRVFRNDSGHERRYVLFIPFGLKEGDKPPLMLFLNGMGENGDDGISHVAGPLGPAIWEMKARFPFVVVFPQCRKGSRWDIDSLDTKWALEILRQTAKEFNTDPDRVYLTGVSWGGEGVWAIARKFPDMFAAIAPMCGFLPPSPTVFAEHHLPIWSFVCSGDQIPDLVLHHRATHESLLWAGASPRYTEVAGVEHDCWNYAYRNPALYEWFLAQSRSRNAADKSRFQLQFTESNLEGWRSTDEASWRLGEDFSLFGQNRSGDSSVRLISKEGHKDFELHLEFQLPPHSNWSLIGLSTDQADEGLPRWELQVIPSESGSGGLFSGDAEKCLQPADPLGQLSLRRQGWNDLRVRVARGEFTASLNGWMLIEYRDESLTADPQRIGFQLPNRQDRPVQWRHIRINEHVPLTR